MHYARFVEKVQEYTGLEKEDATKLIKAVLETLSERMPRTHRQHLAAQLPDDMKELLPGQNRMEYFLLEDFYQRVGNRADVGYQQAVIYSRAVARVLGEAVARGELEDIMSALPDEYRELFGKEPSGPLSPSSV